jgi:hypothetical protein
LNVETNPILKAQASSQLYDNKKMAAPVKKELKAADKTLGKGWHNVEVGQDFLLYCSFFIVLYITFVYKRLQNSMRRQRPE